MNLLNKIEYRLKYRSTKEMDLIFRKFWVDFKENHTKNELTIFNDLIHEDDLEIYNWIIGFSKTPKYYHKIISRIRLQLNFTG